MVMCKSSLHTHTRGVSDILDCAENANRGVVEVFQPFWPDHVVNNDNRIYDGVEAETRKSQASFQII